MFEERLYTLRKGRGLSQEELANEVGVSRQAVQKWESGVAQPSLDKLTALAKYFGVTLDWLVNGEVAWEAAPAQESAHEAPPVVVNHYHYERWHYEYKSKRTLWGMPLVHINLRANGLCWARGVVAVGNVSTGLVSVGAISAGLVSFGALSAGLLALGALTLGLVSAGAVAVGLLAGGASAFGLVSFGGVAVGQYAVGGVAAGGKLAIGGAVSAPVAVGEAAEGAQAFLRDGSADPAALEAAVRGACAGMPGWFAGLMLRLAGVAVSGK